MPVQYKAVHSLEEFSKKLSQRRQSTTMEQQLRSYNHMIMTSILLSAGAPI
jgi:hypothetical protein